MFPKSVSSDAEKARKSFELTRDLLKEAAERLRPPAPSKEALDEVEKIKNESNKLIEVLSTGFNQQNLNKIDEYSRNLARICLNIQQLTLHHRVKK